ncbi:MAG: hypothetical protein GX638_16935 [Crenarchaeota archaeon]|mgnify:CR=1 FL=1|nr:hypothetical protein [Thermoproteota archaeon]
MKYITKADAAEFSFTIKNCDGTDADLSTSTITFIMKKNKTDADADAVLTQDIVNPTSNIILFQFTSTQTSALALGQYVAALKIFKTSDLNKTIWYDDITVAKGVFSE